MEHKITRKKRGLTFLYGALALVVILVVASGVYAKYFYKNAGGGYVTAKDFYFTSDHLTKEGAVYTLNPGTTSISFEVRNHADALRFSADNITYAVTATNGGVLAADGAVTESGVLKGTLEKGTCSNAAVTLSNLENGQSYTVTAIGSAGYQESLSATFTVLPAGAQVYKHLNTTDPAYVMLTVWTENITGEAKVTFPDGLIPDSTDPVLGAVNNYSGGNYSSATVTDTGSFRVPYASRTYRFFKSDAGALSVSNFTVTVGAATAEASTPK